jgi:septal ring factor EnvC (AmiA/AmiB activator)
MSVYHWIYCPFQTPTGQTVASTDFSDGYFHLLLASPIKGGNYTCRIPAQHTHHACLHGASGHEGEATVSVDMVEVRFALLERENRELRQQLASTNTQLADTNTQLANTTTQLANTTTQLANTNTQLANTNTQLADTKTQLADTTAQLSAKLTTLEHYTTGRLDKLKGKGHHRCRRRRRNRHHHHHHHHNHHRRRRRRH